MQILLDTNILLRIADSAHPLHGIVNQAIDTLRKQSHKLVIVPQNLYELWTVATRTVEANGLGLPTSEAFDLTTRFSNVFQLLRDERMIYEQWLKLVSEHEVRGVKSYDARLAAAMVRHGISHLLTLNPSDFRRYAHVELLDPQMIVADQKTPNPPQLDQ